MTTTPPDTSPSQGPAPDSGPRVGWDDIRDLGRLRRSRTDRRLAGVAGGLGRHLDIDPVILRVAFVVLTFFGGAGLLMYVACWLLVPEDGHEWGRVPLDRRSRSVALVLVGLLALFLLFGHWWWSSGVPWVILLVAGVTALVAMHRPRRDATERAPEGAVTT
jgi:phage shock protein PspC (stress-responsive transcriptional regulator)